MIDLHVTIPPAVKTLSVVGSVYGILQLLKQNKSIEPYLKGWVAVVVNIGLTAGGILIAIPPDQLYTQGTLNALVTVILTSLGAAGLHGTTKALSTPNPPKGDA